MRAKRFESMMRPKLHVVGTLCHGHHVGLYVSEFNLAKDSNTSCEVLAHTLHTLAESGVDISACRVVCQADNTCREVKNGIVMRMMAALTSDGIIGEGQLSFLRTGHSHEDVDQLFGRIADYVKTHLRSAQSSSDVVECLESFVKQVDRPFERKRFVVKLDATRNWSSCLCLSAQLFFFWSVIDRSCLALIAALYSEARMVRYLFNSLESGGQGPPMYCILAGGFNQASCFVLLKVQIQLGCRVARLGEQARINSEPILAALR